MSVPEPTLWDELSNGAAWVLRQVVREVQASAAARRNGDPGAYDDDEEPAPKERQRPLMSPPWERTPPWEAAAPPWEALLPSGTSTTAPVEQAAPATFEAPALAPTVDVASSYSDEMDAPEATCINCTRRHLWETRVAAQHAARAAASGDMLEARRQALRVVGEGLVLRRFDWTPEKMAKVKPREGAALAAAAPHLDGLLATTPTPPPSVALAWGSLDEAMRFVRSPRPKPRDAAHINERLDEAGAQISHTESEVLPRMEGSDREWMGQVLPDLRVIRHAVVEHLNGRQPMSNEEIDAAEQYLHAVAIELTPAPDVEQAQEMVRRAAEAEGAFKRALFGLTPSTLG